MTDVVHDPPMFNPLAPGYMEDPFAQFATMRSANPVQPIFDRWVIFGYADCFSLLRDPDMSVDDQKSAIATGERFQQIARIAEQYDVPLEPDTSILNIDPPDHTRLRRLVSKAFTPRSIEDLRPTVRALVDAQLDRVAAAGGGDLVSELAFPLPFDVISHMLGMPAADVDKIRTWSGHIVKQIDPIISDEDADLAIRSSIEMTAHLASVVEWKRANPADDLLTRLIQAEEDGDRLSPRELQDQVGLLFIAGHETTVNLIGTGLYELLRNPDQYHRWREHPDLAANAVDELLRYVSPVQMTRRVTLRDIELSGIEIPAKSFVLAAIGSANRDPDKFGPTADQLDIGRDTAGQHLAFGSGVHYCLGASLAKLEAEVALGSFIERFPQAALAGEPIWNGRINLRGLDVLSLTV